MNGNRSGSADLPNSPTKSCAGEKRGKINVVIDLLYWDDARV
jgi:hypothetical protein